MKNYVADELANKVFCLHKALNQAEYIISVLESENEQLRQLLSENHIDSSSVAHEENCAVSY
jgi:hypothetical protein